MSDQVHFSNKVNTAVGSDDRSDLQTTPEKLIPDDEENDSAAAATTTARWGQKTQTQDSENESTRLLEPDHPLLEKFQRALKEHLLRQTAKLNEEVIELDATIKKQERDREQLGIFVYDNQQNVCRQEARLDNCQSKLTTLSEMLENQEKALHTTRTNHKQEHERLQEIERQEQDMRNELESLALLEQQLKSWEHDMDNELTINQRISEKTLQDKKQLVDEKRKLDIVIYRLMTEIWRFDSDVEFMDAELKSLGARRMELSQAANDANTDLEAIAAQHRGLLQAWGGVIVNLQRSDKTYDGLRTDVHNLEEEVRTICAETQALKRASTAEMEKGEQFLIIRNRITSDINTINRLLKVEEEKKSNLETQLNQHQIAMEQTEKDLQALMNENANRQISINAYIKEIQEQTLKKCSLEENYMEQLKDRLTTDKGAKHLSGLVRSLKDKARDLEISMVSTENNEAKTLLDIEKQRGLNTASREFLDSLKKQVSALEKETDNIKNKIEKMNNTICIKQRTFDLLNAKLDELLQKSGGLEISPQEIKILAMEKQIEEINNLNNNLQSYWGRTQSNVVALSEQRQKLIEDINLLRKQLMILAQKNLRWEDEINNHCKREKTMCRNVATLLTRLEKLNCQIAQGRTCTENANLETSTTHVQYINRLKEAEFECAELETSIVEYEYDKEMLTQQLIDLQRECLSWEKKTTMAVETRKTMEKERSESGEVGSMMTEIHRMKVRHGQLRKAQERLIQDLEHCIARRDSIIDLANAREKRSMAGPGNARIHYARKLNEMQTKLKQVANDTKMYEKSIEEQMKEEESLLIEINEKREVYDNIQEIMQERKKQIEEGQLTKQKNLELLVRKQRRVRLYSDLIGGTYKLKVKNIECVEKEIQKQNEIYVYLTNIVTALLNDFPPQRLSLAKILNTLKSPIA